MRRSLLIGEVTVFRRSIDMISVGLGLSQFQVKIKINLNVFYAIFIDKKMQNIERRVEIWRHIREKHFFDPENILHFPSASWRLEFQKIWCSLFSNPLNRRSKRISMDFDPCNNAHSEPTYQVWNLQYRTQPFLTRPLMSERDWSPAQRHSHHQSACLS